jgi:hypothetical protein
VAPAAQVLDAAERAQAAGATRLGLMAWTEQALTLAAGDYWSAHPPPGGRARRLVAIPLSLARLASSAPAGSAPAAHAPAGSAPGAPASPAAPATPAPPPAPAAHAPAGSAHGAPASPTAPATPAPPPATAVHAPTGSAPGAPASPAAPATPAPPPAPATRAHPAAAAPSDAGLGLHLVIDRETWRLTSPAGDVAALPTSSETSDPAAALQAALARVRSAFATPQTLVLVPGREATAGALVTAAAAALALHENEPLVAGLALARSAPAPRTGTLAQRIARRAGASVDIAPAELATRAPIVRACYQDVLDARPGATGTVRLERRSHGLAVTGPADPGLRACVESTLGPVMRERDIASATATFRLQPRP